MVEAVLETHEVIEGTHRPEVVLTGAPSTMVDRNLTQRIRMGFIQDDLVTIDDDDHPVLVKLICLPVVHIAVEEEELYIVRVEIMTVRVKPIYLEVLVLLDDVIRTVAPEVTDRSPEVFAVFEDLIHQLTIGIVGGETFKHLLRLTHTRQDLHDLGRVIEGRGRRVHDDVERRDTDDPRTYVSDFQRAVRLGCRRIDPLDSPEAVPVVDVIEDELLD